MVVEGAAYIELGLHNSGSEVFICGGHNKAVFFLNCSEGSELGTGEVRLVVEVAAVVEEFGCSSLKHINGFLYDIWGIWWVPLTIFDIEFRIEASVIEALAGHKVFDPKIPS
jgi:hypothetical protein